MIRGPGEGEIASRGKIKSAYVRQAQLNDVQGGGITADKYLKGINLAVTDLFVKNKYEIGALVGAGVIVGIRNICHVAGQGSSGACMDAPQYQDLRY